MTVDQPLGPQQIAAEIIREHQWGWLGDTWCCDCGRVGYGTGDDHPAKHVAAVIAKELGW